MRGQVLLALAGASAIMAEPMPIMPPHMTAAPVTVPASTMAIHRRETTTSIDQELKSECASALYLMDDNAPTMNDILRSWTKTDPEFYGANPEIVTSPPKPTITSTTTGDGYVVPYKDDIASRCSHVMSKLYSLTAPPEAQAAFSEYKSSWVNWQSSAAPIASSLAAKCVKVSPYTAGVLLSLVARNQDKCMTALSILHGSTDSFVYITDPTVTPTAGGSGATVTAGPGPQEQEEKGGQDDGGAAAGITSSSSTGGAVGPRETGYVAKMAAAALGVAVGVVAL
ncbi:hypothetical protein QBC42DRAFT_249045 [Cladorrhinum samala]|uniref:Infection structure specific protein n=1 Tax=Cladorrhinum samala TaxID=585594 RepID=A0AAV9HVN9_9PEZI|nr:hypothetical protein QBC42DRAFT_249045 [Cladorrhinum samala]